MPGTLKWILALLLLGLVLGMARFVPRADGANVTVNTWANLIEQTEALGLPTRFLKEIDPDFVTVAFEDLRTYAAEYHPDEHRMILNLRLSFNKAGGALMDLDRMTHHDVSLLSTNCSTPIWITFSMGRPPWRYVLNPGRSWPLPKSRCAVTIGLCALPRFANVKRRRKCGFCPKPTRGKC